MNTKEWMELFWTIAILSGYATLLIILMSIYQRKTCSKTQSAVVNDFVGIDYIDTYENEEE